MKKPKISVVMSVYNGLPYLKNAVNSILEQTFKDFEFLIVDDASTDGTSKYLKLLRDKRVKIITNSKNLGLAASLNRALKLTKGDYIARMDADDISLPIRFEKQIEFLSKNPSIDLCGTWAYLIDENNKVIGEKKFYTEDKTIKKTLAFSSPIIHPTFLAKKEFFNKLNGYNEKFDYAEDYELLLRAKNQFKFANIPINLFKWRLWEKRRSREEMKKIDKADFRVKVQAYKNGYFGKQYLGLVILKFIVTFLMPYYIKKRIAKQIKLA